MAKKAPPTTLTISLSSSPGPLHIITADQPISGKVILSSNGEHPTGTVTISLLGRLDTMFNKGRTLYKGEAVLFWESTTLHDGALDSDNQQFEWPFEFTFPKATTGGKKKVKRLDIPPYQVADGHKLPPSMAFDSAEFDRDVGKASIVYRLEADFSKSPLSSSSGPWSSAHLTLYHIPSRTYDTPDPKVAVLGTERLICSSKLLDPPGEKPKSFLKRLKTPTFVFEVGVTTPQILYVGGPLPITLTLKHDLANSTAPGIPVVKLTSCTVTLIRTIHMTGSNLLTGDDAQFSSGEILLEKAGLDIPLSESQNLSDLLSIPVPDFHTKYGMTFATYILAQTFKFMVKVTLDCVGERFSSELRGRNILVVSPFTKERLEKGGGDPAALLQTLNKVDETGSEIGEAGVDLLSNVLGMAGQTLMSM